MGLTQDSSDYKRLHREAREHNAVITWNNNDSGLEIKIRAPQGFLWTSCQESVIQHFTERTHDKHHISEAVDAVIQAMQSGMQSSVISSYDTDEDCTGDHTCECSRCEAYDPEIEELHFC
jgi:hypothetical protein